MIRLRFWNHRIQIVILTLVGGATTLVLGQDNPPGDPNVPRTIRITVHAAQPPAIAMQHQLLPRYLELVPGNAAVQYLKALPEGGDADIRKHAERIEQLLEQDLEDFQIEEARKILQDFRRIYEYLRLASVREDCDWNLPIREQDWYSVLLPELQSMRQFGRILALKARVEIVDGEFEKAIESLRMGYATARNTAKGPTLVNALVAVAIARMMNERLLEIIQSPAAPNLYWSVAALPDPFIDIRHAMDLESDGMYLMFPQLKDVATAKLTDDQWNLRLAEFGEKLQSLGPTDVPEGSWQRLKNSLARNLGVVAVATLHYSRAKADLEGYGWPKQQLDGMAVPQVILLHISQTYEILRDDLFRWFHVPYWQAHEGMRQADRSMAEKRNREILPLAALLLPALSNARLAVTRLDREFAAIRTVEALRLHAAKSGGKLPAKLEDITEAPLPLDPITGRLFDYKLEGRTATLEGQAPTGRAAEKDSLRYVITLAEKTVAKPSSPRPVTPKQERFRALKTSRLFSDFGAGLVDLFTTNPILEIGENERRQRSIRNLMHLGLAMANYHDAHRHYPPAASVDKDGKPLLSWRVHVLPYLDQADLYRQFKLDEPWDSPHNKKLIEKMPDIFRVPTLRPLPKYTTTYLVPVGKETIFHDNKGTAIKEITDGTSRTVLIVEADADQAVIWTKPGDWQFDSKEPTRGLGKLRGDWFIAAFADASARQFNPEQDKRLLPAVFTRAGGEKFAE
jgi:hypothetical protein